MKKYIYKLSSSLFIFFGLLVGLILVRSTVHYFSGAGGINANLSIDMYKNAPNTTDVWRNLAQGGEEKGRGLMPVIDEVKRLKPEYIRIDHVFDFYDQDSLDNQVKDILAMGAKPFISLSYMPPEMSITGDVNGPPKDWNEWEKKVKNLIEHVSGRNGLGINNVYYEVWNEPDLFGGYKIGGSKNYLDLYYHSAIAASRAGNTLNFKFGGPSTTGFYPNWLTGLSDYTIKNNLRLDFLSWHKYSRNISDFENDFTDAKEILENKGLKNVELLITEMGPTGSNDESYDNYFGAIHEIALIATLQGNISRAFTFEIKDGPGAEKYWGRWGIFTNEKFGQPVAKPRANALTFLNNMLGGTNLFVSGQGTWVKAFAKRTDANTTKIIVVNYDSDGTHNEIVPIKLTNLSFSKFNFKRTDFLGSSTSEEISTSSATWSTSAYFKPNSAAIFEINGSK
jgi:hypothetical protein